MIIEYLFAKISNLPLGHDKTVIPVTGFEYNVINEIVRIGWYV